MIRTKDALIITTEDCGPGLFWLLVSRRERWFRRHRGCNVKEYPQPREHYTLWFCWTHGKSWTDYFD